MKIVNRVLAVIGATAIMAISVYWFVIEEVGFWHWASAFCAIWFLMAWLATVHLLMKYSFPDRYYRPKEFEKSGRIYEMLGVLLLRKLLRRGPLHLSAPALEYSGRREHLPTLERETRTAESVHLLSFLSSFLLIAYAHYKGWLDLAVWLMLYNVLINIYPIMLQRYNRVRLEKVIRHSLWEQHFRSKPTSSPDTSA